MDGDEDFDGDGLPTYRERLLGTDPLDAYTDGDRLQDGLELRLDLDPTDRDSDDDGVPDHAEDTDEDGLSNIEEVEEGTDPADPDTDGDGLSDGREVNDLGTDPLAEDTDRDLLNDSEELRVGHDPVDMNSNSSQTAANESRNDRIDAAEDLDGDGLTTLQELRATNATLDPLSNDTDGDGLDDRFELLVSELAPDDPDTDGDGVGDAEEDFDDDGLGTSDERERGTNPFDGDSDGDGIGDGEEVSLGFDPTSRDTDDDGLDDAAERDDFPTDPTDPDTDDDGVLDGQETFTSTLEEDGVTIEITGQGNAAKRTSVGNGTGIALTRHAPDGIFNRQPKLIQHRGHFDRARVTVPYDNGSIDHVEELAMIAYEPGSGDFRLLNASVNRSAGTISANTTRFSLIGLIDIPRFFGNLLFSSDRWEHFGTTIDLPLLNEPIDLSQQGWACRNKPRGGRYLETPTKGECSQSSSVAHVTEHTNRRRYYESRITIPEGENALAVRAKGLISDSWSEVAVKFHPDGSDRTVNIFKLRNDWSYRERSTGWNRYVADVSQYQGQSGVISIIADGRWVYRQKDTKSDIDVEYVDTMKQQVGGGFTGDCTPSSEDTDNDSVPDCYEADDGKGLPLKGVGVVNPKALEVDGESDGDGLSDGREVRYLDHRADLGRDMAEEIIETGNALEKAGEPTALPTSDEDVEEAAREITDKFDYGFKWNSLPHIENTDGVGIHDGLEYGPSTPTPHSNPRVVDRLFVHYFVQAAAEETDENRINPLTVRQVSLQDDVSPQKFDAHPTDGSPNDYFVLRRRVETPFPGVTLQQLPVEVGVQTFRSEGVPQLTPVIEYDANDDGECRVNYPGKPNVLESTSGDYKYRNLGGSGKEEKELLANLEGCSGTAPVTYYTARIGSLAMRLDNLEDTRFRPIPGVNQPTRTEKAPYSTLTEPVSPSLGGTIGVTDTVWSRVQSASGTEQYARGLRYSVCLESQGRNCLGQDELLTKSSFSGIGGFGSATQNIFESIRDDRLGETPVGPIGGVIQREY